MPITGRWGPSLACFLALFAGSVTAVPDLAFPFNSQVPPVAYVSQPYEFAFSPSTFVSDGPQISYTLSNGPNWLKLDSVYHRFTGTPVEKDVGANTFDLIASDQTGELSTSITLMVVESTDLEPDELVLPQLEQAGPTSPPTSLLLHPLQRFYLPFSNSTFRGTNESTNYYAVSADNSPLPSWIQYDPSLLLFSGTSPPLVSASATPQTYGVLLIASNIPGFAEAAVHFDIIIRHHILAFSTTSQVYDVSESVTFKTPPLRSKLQLDGQLIEDAQITSVDMDGPEWVKLDREQLSLSGTPGPSVGNTTVTIHVEDIYNNTAHVSILLQVQTSSVVDLGTLADVNVTLGVIGGATVESFWKQHQCHSHIPKCHAECQWLDRLASGAGLCNDINTIYWGNGDSDRFRSQSNEPVF
ncbi:hypothetical protein A1O3_08313 [Capronia epimyces CBS 606.96]|uniref:Dystroglycan-type cadherin-like domain-containing protein n=1 Tax=Capronia epimyces CBS 606.96 TaxID=1182542 RepID=W9XHM8_9EURO|nr:uncharacterized protein A1O3_08313 [Capronia epimyces CBS 606.96]EXJ80027.1 hypothetical protein A1O3_08313 [Capronia epimyces CBS 606.96]